MHVLRTLLTHKLLLSHMRTHKQHIHIHTGMHTLPQSLSAPLCAPYPPAHAHTRPPPPSLQFSAWAPISPEKPDGLFVFISRSVLPAPPLFPSCLPTPRASSSPPARTPAGPHLSPQLMLRCSRHPAGPGSGRRGGKERSWLPEPPHWGCQARSVLASQPLQCAASRRVGRFRLPSASFHSSSSLKSRHWQIHPPTPDPCSSLGE